MLFIESRGVPTGDIAKETNRLRNTLESCIGCHIAWTFSKWPSVVDGGIEIVVVDLYPGTFFLVKCEPKCG